MDMILSALIFVPLLGSALLLGFGRKSDSAVRWTALIFSLVALVLAFAVFFSFEDGNPDFQMVENYSWIEDFNISYNIGIDGISILLVMLTALLTPVVIIASWNSVTKKVKEFHILILFLEMAVLGVFLALDLFLFYIFWEAVLIPMYFLIGVWGSKRRIYAAIKFFLFTMFGSLLMLVAMIMLYYNGGETFNLISLMNNPVSTALQGWLFIAFFLAFAIKVPLFPFHTWLPDAHTEAPMAGSVILAGVLLKMGTYGFMRFGFGLFPDAVVKAIPLVCFLAVFGIIYGALMAFAQEDLKRLVAFSSVSHLGYVMLGLFVFNLIGWQGGLIQMINHGLSTGALFMLVGFLYDRRHTRMISDFGGLARKIPVFATIFMIVTLSSIGLPGLNGFVGEIFVLVGAFKFNYWYGGIAAAGMVFSAVYMLMMFKRVMFGEITNKENENVKDLTMTEILSLIPILIFIVWIGVYPKYFLEKMEPSAEKLLNHVKSSGSVSERAELWK